MRKISLIPSALLAVALTAGVSVTVLAHEGEGPGWGGHHHQHPFVHELHQLDLSDAQKTSIKSLVKASFEQAKPQAQAFHEQRRAFDALSPDAANYSSSASALAQAAATEASARVLQLTALKQQIFAQLTPAQKQQLAALEAKRAAHAAQWEAEHQNGGPGE